MKISTFLTIGILSTPIVSATNHQCYDCKALTKQLASYGKQAVAQCYNAKFPRKQQPDCTKTSWCTSTVTTKWTSTKTKWTVTQEVVTVSQTGPVLRTTDVVNETALTTETLTETVTTISTTTERDPTITETNTSTAIEEILTTISGSTVTFTAPNPPPAKRHYNNFNSKSSSAACHCLHGNSPKKTKTIKSTKTVTKSILAKKSTITSTYTKPPTTKTITIPGNTERKTETSTVTTLTDTILETSISSDLTTVYEPTTTSTDTTLTNTLTSTSTVPGPTVTCASGRLYLANCDDAIETKEFQLIDKKCGRTLRPNHSGTLGRPTFTKTIPSNLPPCSAIKACADFANEIYYAFFQISKNNNGVFDWTCEISYWVPVLGDVEFENNPDVLEVFTYYQ